MINKDKIVCEDFSEALELFQLADQNVKEKFLKLIYDKIEDNDWSSEPEVQEILLRYVLKYKPRTIVEIGTYKGKTTNIIGMGLKENNLGRCYSIDISMCNKAKEVLNQHIEANRIILIEKDSNKAFEDWGRAEIDLLFIDGDHSYTQSCIDFSLWSRLVSTNGCIFIHDTRTRLLREFPEDYIFPLSFFNTTNIANIKKMKSNHEWEGLAKIVRKEL